MPNQEPKTRITPEEVVETRLESLVRGLEVFQKRVGDITYFESSELDDLIRIACTKPEAVEYAEPVRLPGIDIMLGEYVQLSLSED